MKNPISLFLILFNLFQYCVYAEKYDQTVDPLYRNIEIYNGTDFQLNIKIETYHKDYPNQIFCRIVANQGYYRLSPKQTSMFEFVCKGGTSPQFKYQDGKAALHIEIEEQSGIGSKTLVFKNFSPQKNFFLDVVPGKNGFQIKPYTANNLLGYKKSRNGKNLIFNVTQKEINNAEVQQ